MRRGNHGSEVTVKDEQCSRLGLVKPRSIAEALPTRCLWLYLAGRRLVWGTFIRVNEGHYDLITFYIIACLLFISMQFSRIVFYLDSTVELIDGFTFQVEWKKSLHSMKQHNRNIKCKIHFLNPKLHFARRFTYPKFIYKLDSVHSIWTIFKKLGCGIAVCGLWFERGYTRRSKFVGIIKYVSWCLFCSEKLWLSEYHNSHKIVMNV